MFRRKKQRHVTIGDECKLRAEVKRKLLEEDNSDIAKRIIGKMYCRIKKDEAKVYHADRLGSFVAKDLIRINKSYLVSRNILTLA
jgi:hypothetical protein